MGHLLEQGAAEGAFISLQSLIRYERGKEEKTNMAQIFYPSARKDACNTSLESLRGHKIVFWYY